MNDRMILSFAKRSEAIGLFCPALTICLLANVPYVPVENFPISWRAVNWHGVYSPEVVMRNYKNQNKSGTEKVNFVSMIQYTQCYV